MNYELRNLLLGGLLLAIMASIISWLLTNELSPLNEYLLWHPQLRNLWGLLNFPSYLVGAILTGNPHNVIGIIAWAIFFLQWMLIGILITAIGRIFLLQKTN
jgi:hypothetical protein